ncbi:hypothetical protein BJX64DRAFT_237532 [Aspergillus heterothallicus]
MTLNAAQKTNLSVTWILGGLATTTLLTRLYVRFFEQRSPGWDDYAMILSWSLAVTSASLASTAIHHGLGVNLTDIPNANDRVNALKYLTLAPSPSILSVAVGKLSIILFFHRLLGMSMTRALSNALWILIFITGCLSIAAVVAVLAFCIPTESIWDRTVPAKRCMASETQLGIGLAQASFNAFTDIVLGLLPAFSFWNLQMPFRRKIGLMLLFGVGVFGCIITSIKAYQLRNLTGHDNLTKSWSPITIWNTAEMFVLITCANIPMIRSLFRRILNIPSSSAPVSYPFNSTPKATSLAGKSRDRYVSLGFSKDNIMMNSVTASASASASGRGGGRRNSVDRMYPLTRQDSRSPPGEREAQELDATAGVKGGIRMQTEFDIRYS